VTPVTRINGTRGDEAAATATGSLILCLLRRHDEFLCFAIGPRGVL
jgi:hypothetical protein